jgi:AcrR family transcriptional regulator
MDNNGIRKPQQQRSIEKKQQIIEAGFMLFTEKGYHNTNTIEIAKAAGVSTGTVYSYFKDKKDIFIASLMQYYDSLISHTYRTMSEIKEAASLEELVIRIIDKAVEEHIVSRSAHDEIMAMTYLDEDICRLVTEFEEKSVLIMTRLLQEGGLVVEHPHEKIHTAFNLIESYCHEVVYHRHSFLDYDAMNREVVALVIGLMKPR